MKRKFIAVGFAAFVLLVPLALTSTTRAVRRLGFVRWKRCTGWSTSPRVLGVVHFVWRVKADLREPLLFAGALGILLAIRLVPALRLRARAGTTRYPRPARRPRAEAESAADAAHPQSGWPQSHGSSPWPCAAQSSEQYRRPSRSTPSSAHLQSGCSHMRSSAA